MTNQGALQGVRVADFGWVLAGPYATMLLGYMGAEVIKIESRRRPDEQRIAHRAGFSSELDASSNFLEVNFNKKSVTLNLSTKEGAELARQIVATSDVVVENMRPGVMNRLGLGYPDLSAVKPDIIMVSISGWGQSGPLREYTAYAPCFASFGGLAHLIGYADGEPNTGTSAMDARSGTAAAFAALMALNIRQRTGQGQYIDLASGEALSCLVGDATMEYVLTGQSPARAGNRDTMMAPHNCYRCQGDDKWISIAVATDEEWASLGQAMGNPAWAQDPAFVTASAPGPPTATTTSSWNCCRRTAWPPSRRSTPRSCSPVRICRSAAASRRPTTRSWGRARRSARPGSCPRPRLRSPKPPHLSASITTTSCVSSSDWMPRRWPN
jgi:benzylsuccinate CoA-transferase BbsF subunit